MMVRQIMMMSAMMMTQAIEMMVVMLLAEGGVGGSHMMNRMAIQVRGRTMTASTLRWKAVPSNSPKRVVVILRHPAHNVGNSDGSSNSSSKVAVLALRRLMTILLLPRR